MSAYSGYPSCPNCGGDLPFQDFYRRVDVRGLSNFVWDKIRGYHRLRRFDLRTDRDPPTQFSLVCEHCGAASAIDTSGQERLKVVIAVMALGLFGLLLFAGVSAGWAFLVSLAALFVASLCMPNVVAVHLKSTRDAEREDESPAVLLARSEQHTIAEVERLDRYEPPDPEPAPLDPGLGEVAARIDAGYSASAPAAPKRPEYELEEERELERAKVVCDKCGELNQRDFEKCWNCDVALPAR